MDKSVAESLRRARHRAPAAPPASSISRRATATSFPTSHGGSGSRRAASAGTARGSPMFPRDLALGRIVELAEVAGDDRKSCDQRIGGLRRRTTQYFGNEAPSIDVALARGGKVDRGKEADQRIDRPPVTHLLEQVAGIPGVRESGRSSAASRKSAAGLSGGSSIDRAWARNPIDPARPRWGWCSRRHGGGGGGSTARRSPISPSTNPATQAASTSPCSSTPSKPSASPWSFMVWICSAS